MSVITTINIDTFIWTIRKVKYKHDFTFCDIPKLWRRRFRPCKITWLWREGRVLDSHCMGFVVHFLEVPAHQNQKQTTFNCKLGIDQKNGTASCNALLQLGWCWGPTWFFLSGAQLPKKSSRGIQVYPTTQLPQKPLPVCYVVAKNNNAICTFDFASECFWPLDP